MVQNAFRGFGGVPSAEREAELLVVDAGHHRRVAVDVDVGGDPDQHPLRLARLAAQIGDLHQRIDDDAADPEGGRVTQFVDRLRVAMHDDAGRIDTGGQRDRQFACGADVEAGALLLPPSGRRRCVSSDFAAYTISTSRSAER